MAIKGIKLWNFGKEYQGKSLKIKIDIVGYPNPYPTATIMVDDSDYHLPNLQGNSYEDALKKLKDWAQQEGFFPTTHLDEIIDYLQQRQSIESNPTANLNLDGSKNLGLVVEPADQVFVTYEDLSAKEFRRILIPPKSDILKTKTLSKTDAIGGWQAREQIILPNRGEYTFFVTRDRSPNRLYAATKYGIWHIR
jgi:hypothetical protein